MPTLPDPHRGKRVLTPSREYATVLETSPGQQLIRVGFDDGGTLILSVRSVRWV